MFDADKPITKQEDDLLGRGKFAKAIAQIIVDHIDTESHVIGLYGEWGSGKTSTINLIHEQFDMLDCSEKDIPIFLSFSSWGSNSVSDVFSMFMDSLGRETTRLGKAKKLATTLLEYGACISSLYPPVGSAVDRVRTLYKKKKEKTLIELKEQIASILKKERHRFVVVIDDLDRLSDEQIRHVFQFVNVIADFPNVTYLLPFDHEVVSEALSGVQGVDGTAYLDKIIQVPLYLPEPPQNSLINLLNDEVGSLLDADREDYDRRRMYRIVADYIAPYMKTPRDVRRLQNAYLFQMALFSEGLNSLDLLALSSLMVFEPTLFEWVKKNKDLVLGGSYYSDQKTQEERLTASLKAIGISEQYAKDTIQMLSTLFPSIKGRMLYDNASYWRDRRVCQREIFDGYFAGRPKEDWLSTREVADAVYLKDFDRLQSLADKSIEGDNFLIFLEEIKCRLDAFDTAESIMLGNMLFVYWGKSKEEGNETFFPIAPDLKIEFLIESICDKIGTVEADALVLSNIPKLDVAGLAAMAPFINAQELSYGRLAADSQDEEKQRLSLDGIVKTEEAFMQRLSEVIYEDGFLNHDDLAMLMYLWSCFDEGDFVEFWRSKISKDPVSVCYLLASNAGKWTSSETYGWSFFENTIGKVISKENIDETLRSLMVSGELENVPDEVFEKTASFYCNGYKSFESFDKLSAQECRKKLYEKMGTI